MASDILDSLYVVELQSPSDDESFIHQGIYKTRKGAEKAARSCTTDQRWYRVIRFDRSEMVLRGSHDYFHTSEWQVVD